MRKKNLSFLSVLFYCIFLQSSSEPAASSPFFSNNLTTHFYFGQDLNNLNVSSFQGYSLFQYIDDFGIEFTKKSTVKKHIASFVAKARAKGVFGTKGSGLFPLKEEKKFQMWMREISLLYAPTENKNSFCQLGIFPFKVGNGFVLGDAYAINIPISWQYLYEQIDQFRPGLLMHLGNQKKSISGDAYVAMTTSQNNLTPATSCTFSKHLINLTKNHTIEKSVLFVFRINFDPLENHNFQISPSLFFQKEKQSIEFHEDAKSTLYTPSIYGYYQQGDIKVSFEYAKNLGHQKVSALDRTLITRPSLREKTITFDDAHNRYRNEYSANYQGFLAYVDFLLTKKHITWGVAATYASGDNNPNNTHETIFLTRFIPGVKYKDHNKKYKGFIGVDQLYETPALNNLYFGAGNFSYSNLAFIGSTLQYRIEKNDNILNAQATFVSYIKPFAPLLDIANQTGAQISNAMRHYLGTEINWAGSYSVNKNFSLSLAGGVFFASKFYKELKQQYIVLEKELFYLLKPNSTDTTARKPIRVNSCFFVSFGVSWEFDLRDIKIT